MGGASHAVRPHGTHRAARRQRRHGGQRGVWCLCERYHGSDVGRTTRVERLHLNQGVDVRCLQTQDHEVRSVLKEGTWTLHELTHGSVITAPVNGDGSGAKGGMYS